MLYDRKTAEEAKQILTLGVMAGLDPFVWYPVPQRRRGLKRTGNYASSSQRPLSCSPDPDKKGPPQARDPIQRPCSPSQCSNQPR